MRLVLGCVGLFVLLAVTTGVQGERQEEAQCTPGSRWKADCNWCHCTDTGIAACTLKLCVSRRPVRPRPISVTGRSLSQDAAQTPSSDDQNRCLKPVDSGPCFASFRVFRFNADSNRCEPFQYGGCMGNDNRFATLEQCQQTCGGNPPVVDTTCDRTRCPEYRENDFYAVKGCTPVYEGGSCCASRFFCTDTRVTVASENQCEYKGVAYNLGDEVPVTEVCSICHCSWNGELNCISIECSSLFNPTPCRQLYKLDQCCSYDEVCAVPLLLLPDELEGGPEPEPSITCDSEGKSYLEGDKMFFDNHECQKCVCGASYTGPYGAGCSKLDCGYDFRYVKKIQDGCVPLYFEESCCPITFICRHDSRIAADQTQANPQGLTANVCSYFGQSVAVGHELATTDEYVTCRCNTPPDVTCVQIRENY